MVFMESLHVTLQGIYDLKLILGPCYRTKKTPIVAGHSQNLPNLTSLKRGVDGFRVIFH
jgi:hypothetical protein